MPQVEFLDAAPGGNIGYRVDVSRGAQIGDLSGRRLLLELRGRRKDARHCEVFLGPFVGTAIFETSRISRRSQFVTQISRVAFCA